MRLPKARPFVAFGFPDDRGEILCYLCRRVRPARERMARIALEAARLAEADADASEAARVICQYGPSKREHWPVSDETAWRIYRRVIELMSDETDTGRADGADQGGDAAVVGDAEVENA